jgi:regulatory protein
VRLVALRLLGRRDYTTEELRRRLRDRGYDEADVDRTLLQFQADSLLNDERVAQAHVRTASRVKGRGPLRIRRELQARGVDPATIDATSAEVSPDDVRTAIGRFLERRKVTWPIPQAERQRLFQQLLRRGFPVDAIASALRMPRPDEAD